MNCLESLRKLHGSGAILLLAYAIPLTGLRLPVLIKPSTRQLLTELGPSGHSLSKHSCHHTEPAKGARTLHF